jgi:hypothetical protein
LTYLAGFPLLLVEAAVFLFDALPFFFPFLLETSEKSYSSSSYSSSSAGSSSSSSYSALSSSLRFFFGLF